MKKIITLDKLISNKGTNFQSEEVEGKKRLNNWSRKLSGEGGWKTKEKFWWLRREEDGGALILKGLVMAAACQSRRSNRACVQWNKMWKGQHYIGSFLPAIAVQNGPYFWKKEGKLLSVPNLSELVDKYYSATLYFFSSKYFLIFQGWQEVSEVYEEKGFSRINFHLKICSLKGCF